MKTLSSPLYILATELFREEYTRQIASDLLTLLTIEGNPYASAVLVRWLNTTDDQIGYLSPEQRTEFLVLMERYGIESGHPYVLFVFGLRLIFDFADSETGLVAIRESASLGHEGAIAWLEADEEAGLDDKTGRTNLP